MTAGGRTGHLPPTGLSERVLNAPPWARAAGGFGQGEGTHWSTPQRLAVSCPCPEEMQQRHIK